MQTRRKESYIMKKNKPTDRKRTFTICGLSALCVAVLAGAWFLTREPEREFIPASTEASGGTDITTYHVEDIPDGQLGYIVTEDFLAPAKGVDLVERLYHDIFDELETAQDYADNLKLHGFKYPTSIVTFLVCWVCSLRMILIKMKSLIIHPIQKVGMEDAHFAAVTEQSMSCPVILLFTVIRSTNAVQVC